MKLFCLGLHKTGTSSLKTALEAEGFRVASPFGMNDPMISTNALPKAMGLIHQFDALQDDPWYLF
jgi:hypothetical protein